MASVRIDSDTSHLSLIHEFLLVDPIASTSKDGPATSAFRFGLTTFLIRSLKKPILDTFGVIAASFGFKAG